MGYRKEQLTSMGPWVVAYRDTSYANTTKETVVPFTDMYDNTRSEAITGGYVVDGSSLKIYSVGEVRASGADAPGSLTIDMLVTNSVGALSRGYQVRDNAAGSYCADDACYGLNQDSTIAIQSGDFPVPGGMYSSADETRLMGVVVK